MPFQPGNTYGKRPKPNAGRPTKAKIQEKQTAADIIRETLEADVGPLARHYIKRSYKNDKVLTHAIDKLLPEIKHDASQRPIAIQIVHESPNVAVESSGNGVAIHIGSE